MNQTHQDVTVAQRMIKNVQSVNDLFVVGLEESQNSMFTLDANEK